MENRPDSSYNKSKILDSLRLSKIDSPVLEETDKVDKNHNNQERNNTLQEKIEAIILIVFVILVISYYIYQKIGESILDYISETGF